MSSYPRGGHNNAPGANTVIGSVPLRAINDNGFSSPHSGKGGQQSGSPSVPTAGDSFRVSTLVTVLFSRLPANLRNHLAFRHFFTDELDAGAHALCIKYFTLFVLYFCTVFRLEGRRRHFLEQPTERSGREFSAAHKRARTVFHELSTTYSSILLRYSRHSEIQYTARHALLVKGRTNGKSYTAGLKNMNQMLEVREPAFKFESEDFLFYEHLSAFALQIVKLAFAEDTNMQEKAADQVSEMFRSRSFTFNPQRRRVEVRSLERQLDADSVSLKENTAQIAELLTPHDPRIIVKYANQQRTPFIQTKIPGGTSFMRYQRPKPAGAKREEPTKIERQYTIEAEHSSFPMDHPAMYRIAIWHEQQRGRVERAAAERRLMTGLTPEPTAMSGLQHRYHNFTANGSFNTVATGSFNSSNSFLRPLSGQIQQQQQQQQRTASTPPTMAGTRNASINSSTVPFASAAAQSSGRMRPTSSSTIAAGGGHAAASQFLAAGKLPRSQTPSHQEAVKGVDTSLPPLRANSAMGMGSEGFASLNATQRSTATTTVGEGAGRTHSNKKDNSYKVNPLHPNSLNSTVNSSNAFTRLANGSASSPSAGGGDPNALDGSNGGAADGGHASAASPASAAAAGGATNSNPLSTLVSPKGNSSNSKTESDRLELEEREAKFYEIFLLPRLFSTHSANNNIGLGGHLPAAVAGAAAVHNHAVAAAAAATTSKAPPPLPYHHVEPNGPLTTADYKAALQTVIEAWTSFDLTHEIDGVYQAVANGVVVKDLALPSDIMLCYDEVGVLYVNDKDGTPVNLA